MTDIEIVKITRDVVYYKKFPEWIRKKYYETIKGKCSLCHKNMDYSDMEIHRIKRGWDGGLYTFCKINSIKQNCLFLHSKCHKLIHSNELGHISHKY